MGTDLSKTLPDREGISHLPSF